MNHDSRAIYNDYMNGNLGLRDIPIQKLNWTLLGRAAIKEPKDFIEYMFYLCEEKKMNIDIMNCIGLLPLNCLSQDIYERAFKINPKKNYYLIPAKFRTEKMHNVYSSLLIKKEKSNLSSSESKRRITQEKYYEMYRLDPINNYRKIPNSYKTQEICDDFFDINPSAHFILIPGKFLTQRICNIFYELDPISNYEKIPNRFRAELFTKDNVLIQKNTSGSSIFKEKVFESSMVQKFNDSLGQEVYDMLFAKNPQENFKYIPIQNRTSRMYEILSSLTKDYNFLFQIPVQYRTQKIYNIFYTLNSKEVFLLIPDKFKTQTMCTEMLEIEFEKYFPYVPESFYTQEMCDRYFDIDPVNNIGKIPISFRTKEMIVKLFNIDPNILLHTAILQTKETQRIYDKIFYMNPFKAFDVIPYKYKTEKMCKVLYSLDAIKAFLIIPIEFITEDMCIDAMNKTKSLCQFNKVLCKIPSKYRKQKFYDTLFSKNPIKYFELIPKEYRTKSMYTTMLEKDLKKYSLEIPVEFCDDEILSIVVSTLKKYVDRGITIENVSELVMTAIKRYPSLFNVLDKNVQDKILTEELCLIASRGGTLNSIIRQYHLSYEYVTKYLERLKIKNQDIYNLIKTKLEENRITYISTIINDIHNLGEIILNLGTIDNSGNLTKNQKVEFAYFYSKYINYSLKEIYFFDYKKYSNGHFDVIKSFFKNVLRYDELFDDTVSFSNKSIIGMNNSWLYKYDKSKFFNYQNGNETSSYVYGVGEQKLTFEIEKYVINKLEENGIPLRNVIVQIAFYEYFKDSLDDFIFEFSKYNEINFKKKKRSRGINN